METIKIEKILFTGKRTLPWDDVEKYLDRYVGKSITVKEHGDKIKIGSHFADEYCGSQYTKKLHGTLEKAKANAVQILEELVENAENRRWVCNKEEKHMNDARGGWYRYDICFSMPVCADGAERENKYRATLVARINDMGIYLHDMINIKKEASKPFESEDRTV